MNQQQLSEAREKLNEHPDEEWKDSSWSGEDQRQVLQKLEEASLSTLFGVFGRYFKSIDWQGLTIMVATAAAHCVPGQMLWNRIYGGSRSGKTELLRAIARHPDSTEMEYITPASIRGGLGKGQKVLKRINDKLVITKDLASMLTTKPELRTEVFGLLRSVKDGKITSDFGTEEGYLSQGVKFDWIIGTTPVFAQYKQMEDLLGARYIDLNWRTGNREEMAAQAMENNPILDTVIRPAVAEAVCKLIDRVKDKQRLYPAELDDDTKKMIADWADVTALSRSPVARDHQHRVRFHPEPEVGTDLAQGLQRTAKGLGLLDVADSSSFIARLCGDCIPYDRREAIDKILKNGSVGFDEARQYTLEDLRLLGVCEKVGSRYYMKPELEERIALLCSWWI